MNNRIKALSKQKGQAMIEYLVLIAFMAVATIGILRVLNQSVNSRFARITNSIQGRQAAPNIPSPDVNPSLYRRHDMSTFFHGSIANEGNQSNQGD